MKWVSVNSNSSNDNLELWNDDAKLATISVSNKTKLARFVSNATKRMFLVEIKGLLQRRAVIKNEYGIKLGTIENTKQGTPAGEFEFDGKKCVYSFDAANNDKLKVYDKLTMKELFHCDFQSLMPGISKAKSLLDTKFPRLLAALCFAAFYSKMS